jgi:DNA-damage-inducible protein J
LQDRVSGTGARGSALADAQSIQKGPETPHGPFRRCFRIVRIGNPLGCAAACRIDETGTRLGIDIGDRSLLLERIETARNSGDTAIGIFAQKMVNEEGMPFEVTEKDLPVDEEAERRAKRLKTAGIIGAIAALIGLVTGILLAVRSLKEHRR